MNEQKELSLHLRLMIIRGRLKKIQSCARDCHSYIACSGESPESFFDLMDDESARLLEDLDALISISDIPF